MSATKTQVDQLSQDFIGGKKPPKTPVLNQPVERDEQSRIQKNCRIQKLFRRIPKLIHGSERCSLGLVQCCFRASLGLLVGWQICQIHSNIMHAWETDNSQTGQTETYCNKGSKPPPPLANILTRIPTSTYPHERSKLPPPLAKILNRILCSIYLHEGSKLPPSLRPLQPVSPSWRRTICSFGNSPSQFDTAPRLQEVCTVAGRVIVVKLEGIPRIFGWSKLVAFSWLRGWWKLVA